MAEQVAHLAAPPIAGSSSPHHAATELSGSNYRIHEVILPAQAIDKNPLATSAGHG